MQRTERPAEKPTAVFEHKSPQLGELVEAVEELISVIELAQPSRLERIAVTLLAAMLPQIPAGMDPQKGIAASIGLSIQIAAVMETALAEAQSPILMPNQAVPS